jgi:hypothetical protein
VPPSSSLPTCLAGQRRLLTAPNRAGVPFLLIAPGGRAGGPPFLLDTLGHHLSCSPRWCVAWSSQLNTSSVVLPLLWHRTLRAARLPAPVRWPTACEDQIGPHNRKSAVTCNYFAKCCREVAAPLPFELLCFFMLRSFARLTLRAREGRLLVVPASLFHGCVRARQDTKKFCS